MNTNPGLDRRAAAWLADGPTELADRVLDAALREVHLTKQRRALRVPWRFPQMPAFARSGGLAAVALVAVIGAGALLYLNRPGGLVAGGTTGPTSAPTAAATTVATLPPGIPGWTRYTSPIYGFTMAYPSDWSVHEAASVKCPDGRGLEDGTPCADAFISREPQDGQIGLWVWQMPAPAGTDLSSAAGLAAAFPALCENTGAASCEPPFPPKQRCVDEESCRPTITTFIGDVGSEIPHAFVAGPQPGMVTVLMVGREDSYPGAAIYGGSVALLTAIALQVGVGSP